MSFHSSIFLSVCHSVFKMSYFSNWVIFQDVTPKVEDQTPAVDPTPIKLYEAGETTEILEPCKPSNKISTVSTSKETAKKGFIFVHIANRVFL